MSTWIASLLGNSSPDYNTAGMFNTVGINRLIYVIQTWLGGGSNFQEIRNLIGVIKSEIGGILTWISDIESNIDLRYCSSTSKTIIWSLSRNKWSFLKRTAVNGKLEEQYFHKNVLDILFKLKFLY